METSEASHGCYDCGINSTGSEYDVFLSFRGPDTRTGITDHLYECMCGAGLRVFRDDEEIRRGEVIGGELERAIMNSQVYAVVFSSNYASSTWCLRELAMMMDLHRGPSAGRKIILPIFYGVDPCDVKLRTKLYKKALETHEDQYGKDVVKKWEEALTTVGQISGWDSKAIHGEGRLVRLIIQDILVKLRITDRSLPTHLTGINDQVSEMLNLLNCNSTGVRIVVLHGMGGIGKTTLASVIYNKISSQFEGCSFLSNVRESSMHDGGTAKLLNKLSSDILGLQQGRSCNFSDEVNEIIPRLRGKKILLILDDVDKTSQLNKLAGIHPEDWLRPGSRIIVTSRDCRVGDGFIRPELLHSYEMKKLDNDHALQLFSRHCFGTDGPPEEYVSLSGQVVKATGNLPLALEVIGGHLCCQSKEFWKNSLEKLKQVPPKKVFEILRISYDELDLREREIFLDIACFRKEMPRKYAYYLWEARNLFPKCGVPVLVNKSLIKILRDGQFWIHDQLRDMGQEIIHLEGLGSPGKYSRVWDPDHALSVVLQKQVTEKIIAMNLGTNSEGRPFKDEYFRGLSNLLWLQLTGGRFICSFNNLRARLLWLSWEDCPIELNSTIFEMNNLVVLRISGIGSGEFGCSRVGKLKMPNLRVLEIYNCLMETAPDVSCCLKLEIMSFTYCRNLRAIHSSIGKSENLMSLQISECRSLKSLPEELGCARDLRELIVIYTGIEEVPESIGRLESLRLLRLEFNEKMRKLPTSICYLKNLEELTASWCPLHEGIPEEIKGLTALVNLSLQMSEFGQLPTTISQLSSLKSLNLDDCDFLQELPELPTSLTKLTFSSRSLSVVPNLSALTNLTELILRDDSNVSYYGTTLPYGERSQPIEPTWLGKLQNLKSLKLCLMGIRIVLSSELGSLSRLEKLSLSCPDMASVLQLPSSLSKLKLWHSETAIPWEYYSNLRLLTELGLVHSRLTEVQFSELDLLTLKIKNCRKLQRLSNLGNLRRLTFLSLDSCYKLVEIRGLEEMELLERLSVYKCVSILSIPNLLCLRRLMRVDIIDCPLLLSVPPMIDECYLKLRGCPSFEGTYWEYELQRERESPKMPGESP